MSTNLITTILIYLSTNWTGIEHIGQEPGLITTNTVMQVIYAGRTNELKLLSEPSTNVAWRPFVAPTITFDTTTPYITNYFKWE
jgi:hypothetical protein